MKSAITGHMIVKNEEQWVWYAIQSVIDYVEQLIIYDTGSQDRTVDLIHLCARNKISLRRIGKVTAEELVQLRNEQVRQTKTEWFMLLDGDEVWPQQAIEEFVLTIDRARKKTVGIVIPTIVPVGDLFHYQPTSAGRYHLIGKTGHFNLRGYRNQKGYKWQDIYPLETYVDAAGTPIQNDVHQLVLLKNSYWHMTHLIRSTRDSHARRKMEIGEKKLVSLPEVFFKSRPKIVPSPWVHFSAFEKLLAQTVTPILRIKRRYQ